MSFMSVRDRTFSQETTVERGFGGFNIAELHDLTAPQTVPNGGSPTKFLAQVNNDIHSGSFESFARRLNSSSTIDRAIEHTHQFLPCSIRCSTASQYKNSAVAKADPFSNSLNIKICCVHGHISRAVCSWSTALHVASGEIMALLYI